MDERVLIQNILTGDTRSFAYLVDKYKDMVFSIVLRIAKNREDAEDLTQEIFIKAYSSLDKFKGDSKFSTWLFRIAYNEASSHYRMPSLDTSSMESWMEYDHNENILCDELEQTNQAQRKYYIQKAMDMLEDRDAVLLTLFYMEEHSVAEVAEIYSMSIPNVKTALSRARVRMGKKLTEILGVNAAEILIKD